jgi:ABC-type sulfate/molybdate transport systems ATPase subunit
LTAVSIGCRDLVVSAGDRVLLEVASLDIAADNTLAVLGPNGAGKSTLLRALALLGGPRRTGDVLLDSHPATSAEMRAAVAAVFQRPVLQRASALDNAAAGLRLRGTARREARQRARPWLSALGVAHLADQDARTLSGGEAQRVAIARALAVEPRVLLLDEPFTGLDATSRADLIADLRTVLDGLGAAVLLVTHDREEARALADRTAILIAGHLRQVGKTVHVLDAPADSDCAALLGYTTRFASDLTGGSGLLVAKPERCQLLDPGGPPPPNAIVVGGTVRRTVPLGGTTRVDVDTSAEPVAVLTTAEVTAAPGQAVRVAVHLEHVRRVSTTPRTSSGARPARNTATGPD